jgi:hypothetical protein
VPVDTGPDRKTAIQSGRSAPPPPLREEAEPEFEDSELSKPLAFRVTIKSDPEKLLKGIYQATVTRRGLKLSKAKTEPMLVPLGTPVTYLGSNRLSVTLDEREVEVRINKLRAYQNRLARDVAAFLKKGRPLDPNGYALEWYLFIPAVLPLGIPILTLGGALPAVLGFGLAAGCFAIVQQEKWSMAFRLALSLIVAGIGYAVIIALLVLAALHAAGGSGLLGPQTNNGGPGINQPALKNQQAAIKQAPVNVPVEEAPPGVYGDQGGEEILAADPSVPDTLLRCRADDAFYRLSNPRIDRDRFGRPLVAVEYEKTKLGKYDGVTLVIHTDSGRRYNVMMLGPMNRTRGTVEASFMFGEFGQPAAPRNMELYLLRGDGRYGHPAPQFKVSNSTTLGEMPKLTLARNWTGEEIARLTKPPPNYSNANGHPNVGQDTAFGGDTIGGGSFRYVEPGGLLYGLEYRPGEWDKEKCLGGVVAIFKRDQPNTLQQRVLAKEGYAVGGIKVQSKRYVDALQIVFMRIKQDGRLDSKDSYTSDWIGFPGKEAEKAILSEGRRVIGVHCRQGAILNGLALVLDQ